MIVTIFKDDWFATKKWFIRIGEMKTPIHSVGFKTRKAAIKCVMDANPDCEIRLVK